MSDILTSIFAIMISAIIMFIFPLMVISDRTDQIAQLVIEVASSDFVNTVRGSGKITENDYSALIQTLNATGNTYNVEIKVDILDENVNRIIEQKNIGKDYNISDTLYYTEYTTQIVDTITNNGEYICKEGDIISVSVKNTSETISQQLKNIFYTVINSDTYTVATEHSGMVATNGT